MKKNEKNRIEMTLPEFDSRILEVVLALISALEFREPYTVGHSQKVTINSLKIGKKLKLNPHQIHNLRYAGLLHDIGKIGIHESILTKPDKLTNAEYDKIKEHPIIAKSILNPIEGLKEVIPIILHHHENWDGTGYPDGLKKEEIPLEARIIAVTNTYDTLITERPYRNKFSIKHAVSKINSLKDNQLEGRLVECFIGILKEEGKL